MGAGRATDVAGSLRPPGWRGPESNRMGAGRATDTTIFRDAALVLSRWLKSLQLAMSRVSAKGAGYPRIPGDIGGFGT